MNILAQTVQIITERGVFEKTEPLTVGWILIGATLTILCMLVIGLWIYRALRDAPISEEESADYDEREFEALRDGGQDYTQDELVAALSNITVPNFRYDVTTDKWVKLHYDNL